MSGIVYKVEFDRDVQTDLDCAKINFPPQSENNLLMSQFVLEMDGNPLIKDNYRIVKFNRKDNDDNYTIVCYVDSKSTADDSKRTLVENLQKSYDYYELSGSFQVKNIVDALPDSHFYEITPKKALM